MRDYKDSLKVQAYEEDQLSSAQSAHGCQEGDPGINVEGIYKISP